MAEKPVRKLFAEVPRPTPIKTATRVTPFPDHGESFWNNVFAPAAAAIRPAYFLLERANATPVWRERVYAYELYHQLRSQWDKWEHGDTYVLNGEVDKRGYAPVLELEGKNPDFIVHWPGRHEQNLLVVEIKTQDASDTELENDVKKLGRYIEHKDLHYQGGVLLVIGDKPAKLAKAVAAAKGKPILVGVHAAPGKSVQTVS